LIQSRRSFLDSSIARDTWGLELYYNFEINPWLHLTPDLQLVQNDDKDDDFAVIPGIRLVLDF
jgi:carbohydrate-selective porin OprB